MWQIMGSPIAGRGTAKDSGFAARASPTAPPSWKARFQFPLPALRLRGGLFGLCGERLGEGNCYHLMHRDRTHFPDEPNLRKIMGYRVETVGGLWVHKPCKSTSLEKGRW